MPRRIFHLLNQPFQVLPRIYEFSLKNSGPLIRTQRNRGISGQLRLRQNHMLLLGQIRGVATSISIFSALGTWAAPVSTSPGCST